MEGWEGTGAGTREWVFRFGSVRFGSEHSARKFRPRRRVGAAARRDRGARGDGVEGGGSHHHGGSLRRRLERRGDEEREARQVPSATAPREASTAATRAPPASPTRRRPRDAWSRSRTRPPHQRSSSATPRGPRGALPRAPRYAHSRAPIRGLKSHPSLLHRGGARPSSPRIRRFSQKCDLRWTTPGRERTSDPSPLDRSSRSYVLYTR